MELVFPSKAFDPAEAKAGFCPLVVETAACEAEAAKIVHFSFYKPVMPTAVFDIERSGFTYDELVLHVDESSKVEVEYQGWKLQVSKLRTVAGGSGKELRFEVLDYSQCH